MTAAGSVIRAADWPPTVAAGDSTTISNITSTTFITGSPVVATTFTAPTSGRVKITVGGGMQNNGATGRVTLAPNVFAGTGPGGTEVLGVASPLRTELTCPTEAASFYYASRSCTLEGLTPGATYYARVMYRVTAGTTGDISRRDIMIRPLS
ncbi:hypothetical protein [Thermomonospora cellulosilytica]|uniref:Uncharacterized protein n=1 Tax=Thermomonospora cellulosilytica TaxID=1411118 RepID=A0A7W3MU79_9ACTN|nr:hypothetical protein [Thermomonospora cellulosilytica]MBA9002003.1 hypothetical protein [Thermomonospora cellulosilytica]